MPIALKDLIDLEGRVTTGGSKVWAERVSPVTATLAERLIAAGMIVLGKTHTVEFAMGSWGTNTHMGTPRNPWDLAVHRTPGGSSSGSGVAVGAGLAPVAIGTDTGGSVRLPAAWCGIVGLKVTAGRISTYGVLPLSTTLDTPGPMARSVEDAALIYRVLSGPDPRDPQTLAWAPADPLPTLTRGAAGLRLAVMPDAERVGVDADVLAAYDAAVDTLAKLGAEIVRPALPHRFTDYAAATGRIIGAEGYRFVGHLVDDERLPVDPHIRPRIQLGRGVSARDYLLALAQMEEHRRAFNAALAGVDALLTPTSLTPPLPIDQVDQSGTGAHFTRPVNYLGLCGLAVPDGFTAGRPAALASDRLPGGRGGDGAAHRLGLRGRDDLEGSAAAGGPVMSPATLPLGRFTVLDLTRARAGPTCVRQLVDWGADGDQDRDARRAHRRRHGRQSPRVRFPEPAPQQEEHHAEPPRARRRDRSSSGWRRTPTSSWRTTALT